jgi:hypothetical protein
MPQNQSTQSNDLPALTVDGVKKLVAQLDKDRATIANSALSPVQKSDIDNLIVTIQNELNWAISTVPPSLTSVVWNQSIRKNFKTLRPMVGQLLGDLGACFYLLGCIECSLFQCIALGGVFHAGETCP